MKTSELTGTQLDYWAARALGYKSRSDVSVDRCGYWYAGECDGGIKDWNPSNDWFQAGPIIERERITIIIHEDGSATGMVNAYYDSGEVRDADCTKQGDTPLEAAMRAYVASKFGDDVPEDVEH